MSRKKIQKIVFVIIGSLALILGVLYLLSYYFYRVKYVPSENKYENRISYINPETSELSEGFETCNERIVDYYNTNPGDPSAQVVSYSKGKNGLRKFILGNYENRNYSDSGYLNIRFVINCKGKTGRYIVHENDLDLNPKTFNPDLKEQLFGLTKQLKKWNPVIFQEQPQDSYMYISYRIKNGQIIEILP
jgi:hypothetical protein